MIWYFDMDGVLVDFYGGAKIVSQNLGLPPLADGQWWTPQDKDQERMWDYITTSPSFWESLDPNPTAVQSFIDLLNLGEDVNVLTSSIIPVSATAKIDWCEDHLGISAERVLLTDKKHLLAGPNSLLIDDRATVCQRFSAAGGTSVLVAQPWSFAESLPIIKGNDDGSVWITNMSGFDEAISELLDIYGVH